MFYEVARAAVQRIFQDKILLGLVIVGLLAIFVGGFGGGSDKTVTGPRQEVNQAATPQPGQPQGANPNSKVDPALAVDFIKWWVGTAMDYNPQTAGQSHSQAMSWMSPEAAQTFQSAFWTPDIAEGIKTGRISGSFQPSNVQATAANPDGSVVICVTGNLTMHQGQRPVVQQFIADFLVKKDLDGLRVSGLYNRSQVIPGSSVY